MNINIYRLKLLKSRIEFICKFLRHTNEGFANDFEKVACEIGEVISDMEIEDDPCVQEEFRRHGNITRAFRL